MSAIILRLYQKGESTMVRNRLSPKVAKLLRLERRVRLKSKNERKGNKTTFEMGMKGIKCYKCHKEGHIARLYPGTNVISIGSNFNSLCEEQLTD